MKTTPDQTPPVAKTDSTVTTITRLIGSNRGKARLWIEGVSLSSQGWVKGKRYTMNNVNNVAMEYVAETCADTPTPKVRKVAGTDTRPIIDTNTDDILAFLSGAKVGDTVLIAIRPQSIYIRKFNPATDAKAEAMKGKH